MTEPRYGTVVTFYSFKGGVGRTQALADVGVMLARFGSRVLMVDWDLEAPGLASYFRPWLPEGPTDGLLELVSEFESIPAAQAAQRFEPLAVPETGDRLALVRAGRTDATHGERVQALDWNERYAKGFGRWLESLRAAWQDAWDFILIDSRTGISDIGGICTMQLPEVLVVFCTPNDQSLGGAEWAARQAAEGQKRLRLDRAPLRVVPVMTRIDNTERELRKRWEQATIERLGPWVDQWTDAPGRTEDLMRELAVPYVAYWSYGEEVPAVKGSVKDRLGVEHPHETLALLIRQGLTDISALLDDRVAVDPLHGYLYDVFVSYPIAKRKFAKDLVEALRKNGVDAVWDADVVNAEGTNPRDWLSTIRQIRDRARHCIIIIDGKVETNQAVEIGLLLERHLLAPKSQRIVPVLAPGSSMNDVPFDLAQFRVVAGRNVPEIVPLLLFAVA